MTQIPDLKKDFEITVIAVQDQIESLRKNKTLNEDLISKLENNFPLVLHASMI